VAADDPDGSNITYKFQWLANGNRIAGATGPELRPDLVKRGDRVAVEVVATDGQTDSVPYRTEAVEVTNSPPIVTRITLESEGSSMSGRIQAKVDATDPDQDEIQYVYRWSRNDKQVQEGPESVLDTTRFSRKDVIAVEVVARDAQNTAVVARAIPVVLGNSAPEITSTPLAMVNREQYDYAVQAKDVDRDPLVFNLEIAPPGMSIDRSTGQLTWKVAPGLAGTHHVKVIVEDGQGGTTWQEFEISIPSSAQTANPQPPQG
jgi:hypothetical protein